MFTSEPRPLRLHLAERIPSVPSLHPKLKTILIGGGEGHLGLHAVRHFAALGVQVVATCRDPAQLEGLQQAAQGLGRVRYAVCDLAQDAAVQALAAAQGQPVDAVFNAAGGFRYGSIDACSGADFEFLIDANLRSSFYLAKHFVPAMQQRGFGRLVLVSARSTLGTGDANMAAYLATKAALNGLVQALAAENRKTGVRINAVLPTVIATPANREAMPDADANDWVTPAALVDVVAMLCGSTGDAINGALLPVPGQL